MSKYDNTLTDELRNHLNESLGVPFSGVDLAALNIQRGRDHGLPGYTQYQHFCSQDRLKRDGGGENNQPSSSPIKTFEELPHSDDIIEKFRQVYADAKDIDLFTGGISESPEDDGLVGPTFGCIIATQFERLRNCDRFWYETNDERIGFTPKQLEQIKKITISSLVCHNLDQNTEFRWHGFDLPNMETNPLINCTQHPIDLKFWKQ